MRDYRGKRLDTGEWVYGFYYEDETTGNDYIITWEDGKDRGCLSIEEFRAVQPKTIGQYTGIHTMEEIEGGDTSCTFIYEGDIVEAVLTDGIHNGFSWGRHVVVFDRGAFCLKSRRGEITPMCNYSASVKFKVLGNIHDNPELLEVSE